MSISEINSLPPQPQVSFGEKLSQKIAWTVKKIQSIVFPILNSIKSLFGSVKAFFSKKDNDTPKRIRIDADPAPINVTSPKLQEDDQDQNSISLKKINGTLEKLDNELDQIEKELGRLSAEYRNNYTPELKSKRDALLARRNEVSSQYTKVMCEQLSLKWSQI